jgi:hypothetical protein
MKQQRLDDDPLAVLRSLAGRRQVELLPELQREVVSMLHGIGCGPSEPSRIASRLGVSMREVWRVHDAALKQLGLLSVMEAAA